MNDLVAMTRKSKPRSPSFPFITLRAALDRAKQFYDSEKRSAAPFAIAAKLWRFSASSSGALQTAAALKYYGLMSDEGSGANRKLRLTDLALRILLDTRPDSSERDQLKRIAAVSPAIAAEIYEKWQDSLPSPDTINHFLVLERGFNEQTAVKVVKILYENESFTNTSQSTFLSNNADIKDESMVAHIQASPTVTADLSTGKPTVAPRAEGENRRERIISPDGKLVVEISGEPSLESYSFLESYFQLRQNYFKAVHQNDQGQVGSKTHLETQEGLEIKKEENGYRITTRRPQTGF